MTDPGVGGDHEQSVEGLLAPPEELVPLTVAVELPLGVEVERIGGAETIDDHRVVDHQLGRHTGLDTGRITAQRFDPSRMAARSTTAGTPVKSCMRMRAGENAISRFGAAEGSHAASASTSAEVTDYAVLVTKEIFQ